MALQTFSQIVATDPTAAQRIVPDALFCKGLGADLNWYAIEIDPATGLIPVNAVVTFSNDTNYGPVGVNTLRTAAQIGNATGAADFGTGVQGAQTLRVTVATDSVVDIRALASGTDSVAAVQSGIWTVAVSSSALPTGAATSALQTSGNASLSSIDGKTPALGQALMAASVPVAIASDQTAIPVSQSGTWNITNISGTISLPTGAATSALQTTGNNSLSSIDSKTPALGQALMAASVPVVIASDQSAVLVTSTSAAMAYTASGSIAFGSLTNAYTTVITTSAPSKIIFIFNDLDQPIAVSLNGGTSDSFLLDASDECSIDLGPSGLNLPSSTAIQAKYTGSAPTVGSIRVSVIG